MSNSQRYLMKLCLSNNKEFENYQRSARKTILSPSFFIDEGWYIKIWHLYMPLALLKIGHLKVCLKRH